MNIGFIVFDLDDTLVCTKTNIFLFDVERLLFRLKQYGYTLGVASYNPYADKVLKKKGIHHYFDYIEYEDWRFQEKLDMKERMLKTILNKANVNPDNTLFIDDQIRFLETAQSLGINTHFYECGMDMNETISCLLNRDI